MDNALRQMRIDLAAAYRLAARDGLNEGICNHFTVMVPGRDDRFLVIPYGLHWQEVTASRLIEIDGEGRTHSGEGTVEATALYIHARIHRMVPGARCVLHTHMPYATALACVAGGRLEMASQTSLRFHGRIAYDDDYRGLVLDSAEGDRIAAKLREAPVLFLAHHGVIVAADGIAEAYDDLYYLERACRLQVLAQSTGQPLRLVDPQLVGRTARQMAEQGSAAAAALHFAALKRVLDREGSDYSA